MAKYELRQSSVIQGTGPGAMTVLTEGLSVMIPGIDAWFITDRRQEIPDECRIIDANLSKFVGADSFVAPPVRGASNGKKDNWADSISTTIYPRFVMCYSCRRLTRLRPTDQELGICQPCKDEKKYSKSKRVQINFVAACEAGHIDEFPWNEWVHKSASPSCSGNNLYMNSRGSGDLKGQIVSCKEGSCKAKRTLAGTTEESKKLGGTTLSLRLEPGNRFTCKGSRPWLGNSSENCGKDVRMVIRNASNIYYSMTRSSILAPESVDVDETLLQLLNEEAKYKWEFQALVYDVPEMVAYLRTQRKNQTKIFADFDDDVLSDAVRKVFLPKDDVAEASSEDEKKHLRQPEWNAFSSLSNTDDLVVREVGFAPGFIAGVSQVLAVPRLKKTTALIGFSRLLPSNTGFSEAKKLLRREQPTFDKWLPAVQHSGEGIFIQLDEDKVAAWEKDEVIIKRIKDVEDRLTAAGRLNPFDPPSPRKVLLHTLAHLLIQQFVLDCGYMAASLSERIYSWDGVAGVLIYTAGSDSDGTMGGLVEMAKPEILAVVFERSITGAHLCSNDPVCMELGKMGQGNNGSNLAACHSCCLVPETTCEYFNQELDRAMLLGDLHNPDAFRGFFTK